MALFPSAAVVILLKLTTDNRAPHRKKLSISVGPNICHSGSHLIEPQGPLKRYEFVSSIKGLQLLRYTVRCCQMVNK